MREAGARECGRPGASACGSGASHGVDPVILLVILWPLGNAARHQMHCVKSVTVWHSSLAPECHTSRHLAELTRSLRLSC
eukprot:SAG31_NODE_4840_length_2912_cov_1.530750_4_plen_80_part_00